MVILEKDGKQIQKKKDCLGVSLTGIMDNSIINRRRERLPEILQGMRNKAVITNKEWAEKLGIPQSTAITCVKPSGTVSQLVDSASGIHARHNPYYIRTVRGDKQRPTNRIYERAQNIPNEPDVMKPDHTTVFSFPMSCSDTAVYRK